MSETLKIQDSLKNNLNTNYNPIMTEYVVLLQFVFVGRYSSVMF